MECHEADRVPRRVLFQLRKETHESVARLERRSQPLLQGWRVEIVEGGWGFVILLAPVSLYLFHMPSCFCILESVIVVITRSCCSDVSSPMKCL